MELPELPQAGRLELLAACETANCVGFPWPGAEPVRGFDVMDMIEPNCLTDALLTQMLMVQFGGDRDVLVIPVSVTQVLTSCRGDLDVVLSQPKAVPDICARLFHCRWHVYSFIRDGHFVGVLVDRGDPHTDGKVWYVDSLKWDGCRELEVVRAFLGHEARRKNLPSAWASFAIQPQASYCMPVQRTYRRVDEDPIAAHHIDCGIYLFLMMVCLRADESLGMLSTAIVHGARPLLAWSLVLRSNPIVINHWVRLNPVRGPT